MIIFFTRQLFILVKAGIPLLKALQIIHAQLPQGKFKDHIGEVVHDIQHGKSFSEALQSHPQFFSLFFVNMIKGAEVSGNLTSVLKELSRHFVQHKRITKQVQAAIMYPILVLAISVIILVVLLMVVVPVFVKIFQDLGGSLPPLTQLLIAISEFTLHWGWIAFSLLGIVIVGTIVLHKKSTSGRRIINLAVWRVPLFGKIIKTLEIGRFCRMLGTLLSSGVTLIKGLDVLIETTPGALLNRALEDIRYKVEQGDSVSSAMEEAGVFPLTLVKMIQVGEESGKISELFLDAAEDYEDEVTFAVSGLLSLLEPFLIVVMGGIVGFIVIALFFPIFTIGTLVQ